MKLYFYRGKHPNFGDELNTWLLPQVFSNFFDNDATKLFLGIGSILFNTHPINCQKIVFGSGYGGYTPLPVFDKNWKFYCVRGPRTAEVCGLGPDKVAGDAAIMINRFRKRPLRPATRISFMPHWESLERGHWQTVCKFAGVTFIDPRHPVEEVLALIDGSTTLIAEAMHGAIVADALRVPWIPVLPLHSFHRFKWFDWAESVALKLSPKSIWPSSVNEAYFAVKQELRYGLENPTGARALAVRCGDAAFTTLAAARLWHLARYEPMLSSETALARVLDRLEICAAQIKKDFASAP